jgi:Arc/MetJ-type ribon-helix-helix transcriptional regulator
MKKDRESVPISLPKGLVQQLDALVKKGEFSSRSEALRFGARLVLMLEKRLHERAEDYAYSEIREGLRRRIKSVS